MQERRRRVYGNMRVERRRERAVEKEEKEEGEKEIREREKGGREESGHWRPSRWYCTKGYLLAWLVETVVDGVLY